MARFGGRKPSELDVMEEIGLCIPGAICVKRRTLLGARLRVNIGRGLSLDMHISSWKDYILQSKEGIRDRDRLHAVERES